MLLNDLLLCELRRAGAQTVRAYVVVPRCTEESATRQVAAVNQQLGWAVRRHLGAALRHLSLLDVTRLLLLASAFTLAPIQKRAGI